MVTEGRQELRVVDEVPLLVILHGEETVDGVEGIALRHVAFCHQQRVQVVDRILSLAGDLQLELVVVAELDECEEFLAVHECVQVADDEDAFCFGELLLDMSIYRRVDGSPDLADVEGLDGQALSIEAVDDVDLDHGFFAHDSLSSDLRKTDCVFPLFPGGRAQTEIWELNTVHFFYAFVNVDMF